MNKRATGVFTVTTVVDGANGDTPVQAFKWTETDTAPGTLPSGATLNGWSLTAPNRQAGNNYLWMTQTVKHTATDGTATYDAWSQPVRISGEDGDPGADAKDREWIYIGKSEQVTFGNAQSANPKPSVITKDAGGTPRDHDTYIIVKDDFVPYGWSDNAIAVDETTNLYVYASWRDWDKDTETWSDFHDPILWSNWGHQGIDGDGVQYIYKLFASELNDTQRTSEIPDNATQQQSGEWMPSGTTGKNADWYDNPQAPTHSQPFCYCSIIKKINGQWETLSTGKGKFGKLGLWSKWAEDGTDGQDVRENIIDNSEPKYTVNVTDASADDHGQRYFTLDKIYEPDKIPANGTVMSGQARVTLRNCTFTQGKTPSIFIYITSGNAWPGIAQQNPVTITDGVFDTKVEGLTINDGGGSWTGSVVMRLVGFESGTVSVERMKLEVGDKCSAWCLSENDKKPKRLDVDNEFDMVQTTSAGVVMGAQTKSTVVRLYNGSTEVDISAATIAVSGGPAVTVATFSQSGEPDSGKGRVLSWAFIDGKTIADTYDITVSYTYKYRPYLCKFTISASKGQAIYQLKPSHSALPCAVNASNTWDNPPALSLKVVKLDANSTSESDATSSNLSTLGVIVRYTKGAGATMPTKKTDGNEWRDNSVQATPSDGNVYIAMFSSAGVMLDRETVPVIKDGVKGDDGSSPWIADTDNEMDSVSCEKDGKVSADQSVSSNIRLYLGASVKGFTITSVVRRYGNGNTKTWTGSQTAWTNNSGVRPTWTPEGVFTVYYSGSIDSSINKTVATITGKDEFYIYIQSTDDPTVIRQVSFTVNAVEGSVYNLIPKTKEIVATLSDGSYTVDGSSTYLLVCGYSKKTGAVEEIVEAFEDNRIDEKYDVYFCRHTRGGDWDRYLPQDTSSRLYGHKYYQRFFGKGRDFTKSDGTTEWHNQSSINLNNIDAVEFIILDYNPSGGGWAEEGQTIIDRETVYVVNNGQNGTNGDTPVSVFAWNTSPDVAPAISGNAYPPDGWSTTAPNRPDLAVVERPSFTTANWNTFGTVGRLETWGNTSAIRTNIYSGNWFVVAGRATDGEKKFHTLFYQCDNNPSDGNLHGVCMAHYTADSADNDYYLWMSQSVRHNAGIVSYESWGTPVRISGDKGDAGEDGDPGADAKDREWIYIGKSEQVTFGNAQSANPKPSVITKDAGGTPRDHDTYIIVKDDFVPYGWSDNAIAVDDTTNLYVYASWRDWNKDTETWSDFHDPILWSNWGHQGIDGDGVQYIYKLFASELNDTQRTSEIPDNATQQQSGEWMPSGTTGKNADWYDNPQAPTSSLPFCYCSIIKKLGGAWETLSTGKGKFGTLGLWSKWAEDGTSPWFADLDNEMDSVACGSDGKPTSERTPETTVSLWHGSTLENITSVKVNNTPIGTSWTTVGNFSVKYETVDTKKRKIQVKVGTTSVLPLTNSLAIEVSNGTETRNLSFVINGVRPGVNGEPAVLFDLLPSASSVKRDKNGTLYPAKLTCDVQKTSGSTPSRATSSDGTLYYRKNGDITAASDGTSLAINTGEVTLADTDTYVTFAFFDSGGTLRDKERVVIVYDGTPGTIFQRIYKSTNSATESAPTGTGYPPTGWSTTPTSVTKTARYRHMSERHSEDGGVTWGSGWSTPQIDAYLSEDGTSIQIKGEAVGVLTWGQADKGSGDTGNLGDIWLKNNDGSTSDYLRYESPSLGVTTWVGHDDSVLGDGYIVNGYLWMKINETASQSQPRWKNVGQIQGPKGDNAINLSLDNEHEDFLYNDAGTRIAPSGGATSQARLYDGPTPVTSGITWEVSCDGGSTYVSASSSFTTGSVAKAKISTGGLLTVDEIYANTAKVKVRATYNNKPYYAEFTANKTSQDKYDLKLTPSAIAYNPANYPSQGVTIVASASRTDLQGNQTTATIDTTGTITAGHLYLFYAYVNSGGSIDTLQDLQATSLGVGGWYAGNYAGVYFELRLYTDSTHYRLCDHETVEIAKVQNGGPGPAGADGADSYSLVISQACAIFEETKDGNNNKSVDTSQWVASIQVFKGGTAQNFTIPSRTSSHCNFSLTDNNGQAIQVGTVVDNAYLRFTSIHDDGSKHYSDGYFEFGVQTADGEFSKSGIRIPFYVNLVGTWQIDVEEDVVNEVGRQITYGLQDGGAIKTAYEGAIERSAKGLSAEFKEETGSAANTGNKNLFGFHKDCAMTNSAWPCVPFIQGYGIAINNNYSGARRARIANLGFGGAGGPFVVSFSARLQYGDEQATYKINVNLCDDEGKVILSAKATDVGTANITLTTSWGNYAVLFDIPANNDRLMDHSDILDFEDLTGNITSYIYIRHLKVERGEEATAFCEADEDIAYIGQGQMAKMLTMGESADAYGTGIRFVGDFGGKQNAYCLTVTYETMQLYSPWGEDQQGNRITVKDYLSDVYNSIANEGGVQLEPGKCYTLSYWAMVTGGSSSYNPLRIVQHLYPNIIGYVDKNLYDNGSGVAESLSSDGYTRITLSQTWKQYFVRFFVVNGSKYDHRDLLALRLSLEENQTIPSGTTYVQSYRYGTVYIADVKLEEGYVMDTETFRSLVEQNARRISLMQYTGSKAAGMDIQNGIVDLLAERVTFSYMDNDTKKSDKIWIDPASGTLHAVDGDFSGTVTATGGTIGGFTVESTTTSKRLYNSAWDASIEIAYDSKTVKIGKNAKGELATEQAIIRAENTKTGQTYNTALYLMAKNATYNYAFYGEGNGVLNGLVVGYKVGTVQISGEVDKDYDIKLTDGTTIFIIGNQSKGRASVWMPKISHVRQALGLKTTDTTTPFAVEISIINLSTYEFVRIHFRHNNIDPSQSEYPWHMSYDNVMATEDVPFTSEYISKQIAEGDYIKILLVYYNGLYRAEVLRSLDGGWGY